MGKRRILIALLSLVTIGLLLGSSIPVFAGPQFSENPGLLQARELLEQRLVGIPGFAGIAHSEQTGQVVVFLENAQAGAGLPDSFLGFSVKKEVTGEFRALRTQLLEAPTASQDAQATYDRLGINRPLVGGVSVSALAGTRYIYAGTLGMVTYDDKILSNAHVIAMNPDDNSFLSIGTTVVQPGTLEGGFTESNRVGQLEKYIPITYSRYFSPVVNYADAAIASIDTSIGRTRGAEVNADETGTYLVSGITTVADGDTVNKSGRTTGFTTSTVAYNNASTWVDYGSGKKAYFADQIFVNQAFIDSGDSGSCVDKGGQFVGLAFASGGSYAIVSKASHIVDGLGISLQPTAADFSISASPTAVSFPGGSGSSFEISVSPSGGFNSEVALSASGPSQLIVNPTSTSLSSPYSAPATFDVSGETPGTYTVTVSGTSGSISHTADVVVTVLDQSGQLSVAVSRDRGNYRRGQTVIITVSVTSSGLPVTGATVDLSIAGPSPSPTVVYTLESTTTEGTAYFRWDSTASVSPGTYTATAQVSMAGYVPADGSVTFKIR